MGLKPGPVCCRLNDVIYIYIITPDGSQTYIYTNSNIHVQLYRKKHRRNTEII